MLMLRHTHTGGLNGSHANEPLGLVARLHHASHPNLSNT